MIPAPPAPLPPVIKRKQILKIFFILAFHLKQCFFNTLALVTAPVPAFQQVYFTQPPQQVFTVQPQAFAQQVINAPYPSALPFPTHYGEPALPLQFLKAYQ